MPLAWRILFWSLKLDFVSLSCLISCLGNSGGNISDLTKFLDHSTGSDGFCTLKMVLYLAYHGHLLFLRYVLVPDSCLLWSLAW